LEQYNGVYVDRGCLFVSTTGLLLTGYVNCEVIYPHYEPVNDLVEQLIRPFMGQVEGFICPSTGDIVLAQYATRLANESGHPTTAAWADRLNDNSYRVVRNGFEPAIAGRRVLVLNDRISQGGTTRKVIAEARRLECEVLGVATLAGVSTATAEALDVPTVHALCIVDVQSFPVDAIPPAFAGLPIAVDKPLGHGHEFREHNPDWPHGWVELMA
jgi:orotate phosphoribosyltransferase